MRATLRMLGVLMITTLVAVTPGVMAEGRCPPGHYPIGGQGVEGCAPMGGSNYTSGSSGYLRPSGRWKLTWGGVAAAKNGVVGLLGGARSRRLAEEGAMSVCREEGGEECNVVMSYKNACVAGAKSAGGEVNDSYVTGPSVEVAASRALSRCNSIGGVDCETFLTGCTEPKYIAY